MRSENQGVGPTLAQQYLHGYREASEDSRPYLITGRPLALALALAL